MLGFVARRLAGSRVGFLAALRSGEQSSFERAGLPQHEVAPLDEPAAAGLVNARFPALAPHLRQRVLTEGQGNPLALLELSVALGGSPLAAGTGPPTAAPLSAHLQAMYASQVTALPARTRRLLLLMALDGTGDPRVLRAGRSGSRSLEDLAVAERARLAHVDHRTHRLAFRHPLIRATVVELSTDDQRRRAHEELAGLLAEPDRHAWHLAEAAVEPDEHVASLLEEVSQRVLARGDAVDAGGALTQASDLSPRRALRSPRMAEAAYIGANVTGQLGIASRLLADAHRVDPEQGGSLEAAIAASYVLLNGDGDVETAHRLRVGAIENRATGDDGGDGVLEEPLHALLRVCWFGGRAELWQRFHDQLRRREAAPVARRRPTAGSTLRLARTPEAPKMTISRSGVACDMPPIVDLRPATVHHPDRVNHPYWMMRGRPTASEAGS